MVSTVVLAAMTMKAVMVATIAVLWWQKWLQVATAFLFRTVSMTRKVIVLVVKIVVLLEAMLDMAIMVV